MKSLVPASCTPTTPSRPDFEEYCLADLHCHSDASDGLLKPTELAARAHANGVQLWALTDHDTLAGQEEARAAAVQLQLGWVSGVEVSTLLGALALHIVGLNVALDASDLQQLLAHNRALRRARAEQMAGKLEQAGFHGVLDGAMQEAGSEANLARPHFARYLVDSGQADSVQEVFHRYLGDHASCFMATEWVQASAAIAAIRAAGGVAVLAHPLAHNLSANALQIVAARFAQLGGQAMEVVSGNRQSPAQIEALIDLANSEQLLASCGSDFHVPGAVKDDLGRMPPLPSRATPIWTAFCRA